MYVSFKIWGQSLFPLDEAVFLNTTKQLNTFGTKQENGLVTSSVWALLHLVNRPMCLHIYRLRLNALERTTLLPWASLKAGTDVTRLAFRSEGRMESWMEWETSLVTELIPLEKSATLLHCLKL